MTHPKTLLITLALLGLSTACPSEEMAPPTGEEESGEEESGDGDPGDGDGDPGDGDGDGDECLGPDGCFACEPTSSIELTNACTDATCEPFENTTDRLPLLERDGSLPPLP
jgi:hypothetical protein